MKCQYNNCNTDITSLTHATSPPQASLSGGLISVPLCDLVMITFGNESVRVSLYSGTMFQ